MSDLRLHADQISVGTPLPFDTFDQDGKLLLRKGFVIDDPQQLARLLARGLFREATSVTEVTPGPVRQVDRVHKISVIGLVGRVQDRLETLLAEDAPVDFPTRLQALAGQLADPCGMGPDS